MAKILINNGTGFDTIDAGANDEKFVADSSQPSGAKFDTVTGGESGYSGYSGYSGTSGTSGIDGWIGISGYSGYSGDSGINGFIGNGESGWSGISGYVGTSGYSGQPGGQWKRIVKIGNSTTQSVSPVDLPELSFPILANKDYIIKTHVLFYVDNTSRGMWLTINGPSSPTFLGYIIVTPVGATSSVHTFGQGTYNSGAATTSCLSTSIPLIANLDCILRNGNNEGTISIRYAVSNAANVLTVLAGSYVEWIQLN